MTRRKQERIQSRLFSCNMEWNWTRHRSEWLFELRLRNTQRPSHSWPPQWCSGTHNTHHAPELCLWENIDYGYALHAMAEMASLAQDHPPSPTLSCHKVSYYFRCRPLVRPYCRVIRKHHSARREWVRSLTGSPQVVVLGYWWGIDPSSPTQYFYWLWERREEGKRKREKKECGYPER